MKHIEAKDLQAIIDNPGFGNLAKLAVSSILAVGVVVAGVIIVARGGDMDALRDGLKIFTPFLLSALTGGAVNVFGDSETAKHIKEHGLPVETVESVAPISGVSLPASHPDIRGNFDNEVDAPPALLARD